jgi:hypothetical protein
MESKFRNKKKKQEGREISQNDDCFNFIIHNNNNIPGHPQGKEADYGEGLRWWWWGRSKEEIRIL